MNDEAWQCPKCKQHNSFWRSNCWRCGHIYLPGTVTEKVISLCRELRERLGLGVIFLLGFMLCCHAQTLPNHKLTPGAVTKATAAQLCAKGFTTKSMRPPEDYTEALKKKQLAARYKDRNPAHYEEDHLISLEIGGDPRSSKNLWPQPYAGKCGAKVKDKLEDKLKTLVCAGKLKLADAQHAISSDWVKAYNKYVGKLSCQTKI